MSNDRRQAGFSLVELLVVLSIIAVLATLILPAVMGGRESARKMSCASNLRQVGLALAQYESTYRQLVPMRGGPLTNSDGLWLGSRMSGFVGLCPFLDRGDLYHQIQGGFQASIAPRVRFARGGEPWWRGGNYTPWRTEIAVLRCPSDPGRMLPAEWASMGRTNFAFSMGDSQKGIEFTYWETPERSVRGMFQQRYEMRYSDCSDGLSNTIALGEIATPQSHQNNQRTKHASTRGYQATSVTERVPGHGVVPADCWVLANGGRYVGQREVIAKRGTHWGDGNPDFVGFNTIIAPNGPSCVATANEGAGLHSAASYHMGGAHVQMLDQSIHFISEAIDTGNMEAESPGVFYEDGMTRYSENWFTKSVYGAWGSMGSRNASD